MNLPVQDNKYIFLIILYIVHCLIALVGLTCSIDISYGIERKQDTLPDIISFPEFLLYSNDTVVNRQEYLRKRYSINNMYTSVFDLWSKSNTYTDTKLASIFGKLQSRGFVTTLYQTVMSTTLLFDVLYGDSANKLKTFLRDQRGKIHDSKDVQTFDHIPEQYFNYYAKPMIDRALEINCNNIRLTEYDLLFYYYAEDTIKQFRKDLMEKDEGIDWLFYDGHIEHLNFWAYGKVQHGITKEDYEPEMLGEFTSYDQYAPVDVTGNGEPIGYSIDYKEYVPSLQSNKDKYHRNEKLFYHLKDYESFKIWQKWYKYAKEKGIKYCSWGPNNLVSADISHDPYVDYVGQGVIRGTHRYSMIPGGFGTISFPSPLSKAGISYIKGGGRYFDVWNDGLGKASLVSTETVTPYRMSIGNYRDAFSSRLVLCSIIKPKYFMGEFPITDSIFETGLPYSIRQYNLAVVDSYRQVIESKLNTGKVLRSNWLIQTNTRGQTTFGNFITQELSDNGDMKSQLYLQGYIPDIEPCNGTDRMPLNNYKVITMGGGDYGHYSSMVIDNLKKWLEEGAGRTLFTNYLYVAQSVISHGVDYSPISKERYTELGIWNTSDISKYKVREVSWVDETILPNVKLGEYVLEVALPDDIYADLPSGAKIVMKGITENNKEVPLVIIVPKDDNRIINVAFALNEYTLLGSGIDKKYLTYALREINHSNLELGKNVMSDLFSYIQKEDNFNILRVKCSYPMDIVFRAPVLDAKGVVTICAVGTTEPSEKEYKLIEPLILEYENHKIISKINNNSMVIASLDGSALASSSSIKVDNTLYVKGVEPETLYILSSLDNKSYDDSKLFHLWAYENTTITFLKPRTWKNDKSIKVYNFDGMGPVEVGFKIKDEYIEVRIEARKEYKISYEGIESSLWKEFCKRLMKEKEEETFKESFDDSECKKVSLDNVESYVGAGWYRVHCIIPELWKGNSLVLELGKHMVHNSAKIYFNGEHQTSEDPVNWSCSTDIDYSRRCIISKKIIKYGKDNVIDVQIYNIAPRRGIYDRPIRLVNPATGEEIDISKLDWLYKEIYHR